MTLPATQPATRPASAPASRPASVPASRPANLKDGLRAAVRLVAAGRYADADAALDACAPLETTPSDADALAYYRALVDAYRADLAAATAVLRARVPADEARLDDAQGAWIHNQITWLRWAAGDLDGALAENTAMGAFIVRTRDTLPARTRRTLSLHYLWDRAYLVRDLAGAGKATLAGAEKARAAYDALGRRAGDHDGMAVLDAYFAVRAASGKAALAAARRVDWQKDGDVQDLYILERAHDLGGDPAGAAAIRAAIRADQEIYLMIPLILPRLAGEHGTR